MLETAPALAKPFKSLTSVRSISRRRAIELLAELLVLPPGRSVREWVAQAGLDVRRYESGTSVDLPRRISRVGRLRLRRALYMPAQVASKCEPATRAFYAKLRERGKRW